MSSQLRKTRSMDSSCLELRPGPPSGNVPSTTYQGPTSHLSSALSRARSEANLHASTLSLDPGKFSPHFYITKSRTGLTERKNNLIKILKRWNWKGIYIYIPWILDMGYKSERIEILIRSCVYIYIRNHDRLCNEWRMRKRDTARSFLF